MVMHISLLILNSAGRNRRHYERAYGIVLYFQGVVSILHLISMVAMFTRAIELAWLLE